jgi:hypothetical protein
VKIENKIIAKDFCLLFYVFLILISFNLSFSQETNLDWKVHANGKCISTSNHSVPLIENSQTGFLLYMWNKPLPMAFISILWKIKRIIILR